jgi:hypothetical protein
MTDLMAYLTWFYGIFFSAHGLADRAAAHG